MVDSASESDSGSVDGHFHLEGGGHSYQLPSPVTREQVQKRIESLQQQNRVLNVELETYKLRVKSLQEEKKWLRQATVNIQVKAEQEEEFISNTLLKKIQDLKKEKESLALNYEQEEECLTNDLSRKLIQLRQEKVQLEHTLEQEQECLVNKLMRKIKKLETETGSKQATLDQLRREKVELENTLEQEQEALVNKLWKRMDTLESEKRGLQIKLDQPLSEPLSEPLEVNGDTADNLADNIHQLRQECDKLKKQLTVGELNHRRKMSQFEKEEKHIREENLRLQRKLQLEMGRREALCRHLSESESSLEMEEERDFNEMTVAGATSAGLARRARAISSPGPGPHSGQPPSPSPSLSRPLSPGLNFGERTPQRRESGGPLPCTSADSFPPPTALTRFHSGSFLPSPAPLGAAPRSLTPRDPPQEGGAGQGGGPEKRFALPGASHMVCTASSTPVALPNIKDDPPASPMDTNLM